MKKISILFTLFFLSQFVYEFEATSQELSDFRWTIIDTKGECTGRHENTFVAYNNKFYLLGGRGVNPVYIFDLETNTWETRGKSPMEIHHFQAVVYKNVFYLVGSMEGKSPTETTIKNIWMY